MGKVKKHNGENWEIFGSSEAGDIAVRSPKILKEDEEVISVETALERVENHLDKHDKNIAWLTKYGGGGSGSGSGGSTITDVTGVLKVNDQLTDSDIVMDNNGLSIVLSDVPTAATKAWDVTVHVGTVQVASTSLTRVSNRLILSANKISAALVDHHGILRVNAVYKDDVTLAYGSASWDGDIYESVVNVNTKSINTSLIEINSTEVIYNYSVGYIGNTSSNNYKFTIVLSKEDKTIENTRIAELRILDTTEQDLRIPLSELFPPGTIFDENNNLIGVYTITATLEAIENNKLKATTVSNVTIASDDILIATTTMSTSKDSPNEVSLDGDLNVQFTAHVQGMTDFKYNVFLAADKDLIYSESTKNQFIQIYNGTGVFKVQVNTSISVAGKSWAIDDEDKEVVICLLVTSGTKTAIAHYYVKFVEATSSLLSEDITSVVNKVFDFEARLEDDGQDDFSFSNQDYTYGSQTYPLTSKLDTINGNDLSVIRTRTGIKSLRLSNGAVAHIHDFNFNNQVRGFNNFFSSDSTNNQFTISICFKADYHADDERTILFCGAVDMQETIINEETGQKEVNPNYMNIINGVSIDVHNVYINREPVCPLTDNIINMVDIVGERTADETKINGQMTKRVRYVFKVYLNGVLSAIKEPSNEYMMFGNDIYLGCRHLIKDSKDSYVYLCDCDIYDLKVYTTALNDFEITKNYINNLARVTYKYNASSNIYEIDYSVIDNELRKNFCSRDANNDIKSELYKNGTYTINFLLDGAGNNLDEQQLNDRAKALSIPIMLIDVSGAESWTFNEFVAQQSAKQVNLPKVGGQRVQYWDPNGNYNRVVTFDDATIGLQGTSTLENAVKNIDFTIPDSTIFIPKDTWLPEQTYTLKSDVIDSSHSNNASIGYFINTVLGAAKNKGEGAFFPFNETAKDNVYNSPYVKNQQPTATLKHTVEGFPVFVIMKFHTSTTSTVSVTPLGIYSFNLGRNAYRNLGFKKIDRITFGGSDTIEPITVFPFVGTNASVIESDSSNANWIEIDGTSAMDVKDITDDLPENFDSSIGDFWQDADNILDNRYSVRYPAGKQTHNYSNFKNLVGAIMKLPIEGMSTTSVMGTVTTPQIATSYTAYDCASDGTNYYPTSRTIQMSTNYNDHGSLNNLMDADSFYKYFVIGLLFGLVDNFGKNSTYRSWNGGPYFMGFYDLDTGLKNDNQGKLTIDPDTWFKFIYNKKDGDNPFGYMAETEDQTISLTDNAISARSNKLWLSLDTPTARAVFGGSASSSSNYTAYWYSLRSTLQSIANQAGYDNFADYFVDEFFSKQTGDCGALIFNYDYKLKYLLQFTNNLYERDDDISRLHGRKIASTREWLKKRLIFLDSIFYWRDISVTAGGFRTNLFSMGNNNVYNTPSAFPMKTNTSLVLYNQVGTNAQSYYFMKRNVSTMLNMANNASNSVVSWNFSHSPNVIEFGDSEHPLSQMNLNALSHSDTDGSWDRIGYPSITELNLSNTKTLGSTSPLISFHAGSLLSDRTSELRVIDLSNTAGSQFSLDNDLITITDLGTSTDFSKLRKIDITKSECVTNISIPPVPLQELNVAGSSITRFTLENQAYLTNVNLANCTSLGTIVLRNCTRYGNFSISNLGSLTSLTIAQCPQMESITVNACGALRTISIQNNSSLKSIIITNCPALTGTNVVSNYLTITDCPALTSINLSENTNLAKFKIETSNEANITTLNLKNTKVTTISGNTGSYDRDETLVDLRDFTGLQVVNFNQNSAVQYIRFANNETPIPLTVTFQGCSELLRIYGHVKVMVSSSAFESCKKFSIHGTENIKFDNKSVMDGGRFKMPYEVLGVTPENFEGVGLQPNASNALVTNMDFGNTSLAYYFYNTAVTTFDVYYVFSNSPAVTSYHYTFGSCKNIFYWTKTVDNSPNRNMLRWANSVVSLAYCFYNTTSEISPYIRMFTPTVNGDNIGTDGLFSSVCDTLENMYLTWSPWIIVTNRYLFRHPSKNFNSLRNIEHLKISLLHDNVNTGTYEELVPTRKNVKGIFNSGDYSNIGDWTDFFKQMANAPMTCIGHIADDSVYINYDTIKNIPSNITRISGSFNSIYGSGEMKLGNFITSKNKLQAVTGSFRVSNRYAIDASTELRVEMPIESNYFEGFVNLVNIGHAQRTGEDWDNNDSSSSENCLRSSFMGYGIHKYINQDVFPDDILTPCMGTIQVFSGFFSGLESDSNNTMVTKPAFPGKLFYDSTRSVNATNLKRVGALFYNVNIPYTISSRGFAASTQLTDVSYMFAATDSIMSSDTIDTDQTSIVRKNYGEGYIPEELFYHGEGVNARITYKGINGTVESIDDGYKILKDGAEPIYMRIENKVVKWYSDEEMTIETTSPVETHITSYRNVNRRITTMRNCFTRCNFAQYERPLHNDSSDYEANDRYQPFDWIYSNNAWSSASTTKNTNLYTDMWKYDGNVNHKTKINGVENLDVVGFTIEQIVHPVAGTITGTTHFMCAPDLLRYCSDACDIYELFAYSGHDIHSASYGNTFSGINGDTKYGVKGRIVPWLFYPFRNNTNVSFVGIFRDCKMLSAYKTDNNSKVYLIPEDLFKWCPNIQNISYMFSGLIFPTNCELTVFDNIPANKLADISYVFYRPLFQGSNVIQNVFSKFTGLSNIIGAFAITTTPNESGGFVYNQSVRFTNNFKNGLYNTDAYKTKDAFRYVFAGYKAPTFEIRTLLGGNRYNYMKYDGSEA